MQRYGKNEKIKNLGIQKVKKTYKNFVYQQENPNFVKKMNINRK